MRMFFENFIILSCYLHHDAENNNNKITTAGTVKSAAAIIDARRSLEYGIRGAYNSIQSGI